MDFPPIALITDFGLQDPYVGILKAVIHQIAPAQVVIDITHHIPPGDIRRAAVVLWQSRPYFAKNTIFVVVVDPGVGTSRSPILVRSEGHSFIGPDNGVFTFVTNCGFQAWEIDSSEYTLQISSGNTFHGRDIFAPSAAHLSQGVAFEKFGKPIKEIRQIKLPECRTEFLQDKSRKIHGEVLFSDHFGNLLTSIGSFRRKNTSENWQFSSWLTQEPGINIGLQRAITKITTHTNEFCVPIYQNFQEVPKGEVGGMIGSSGLLEIVANQDSAENIVQDPDCTIEVMLS